MAPPVLVFAGQSVQSLAVAMAALHAVEYLSAGHGVQVLPSPYSPAEQVADPGIRLRV